MPSLNFIGEFKTKFQNKQFNISCIRVSHPKTNQTIIYRIKNPLVYVFVNTILDDMLLKHKIDYLHDVKFKLKDSYNSCDNYYKCYFKKHDYDKRLTELSKDRVINDNRKLYYGFELDFYSMFMIQNNLRLFNEIDIKWLNDNCEIIKKFDGYNNVFI
ncbi:hypothetical protein ABK040_004643 [Willaertia magna]